MATHRPLTLSDGAGMLLASAIWGGSLVVAKIGMTDFSALMFVTLRFAIGAAILLPLLRRPLKRAFEVLLLSFSIGGLHFVCMFAGVDGIDAASASIILLVEVPLAALLAAIFHRDYLGWRRTLGMAIALAGVAIVIGQPKFEGSYGSVALVLAAGALWGLGAVQLKSLMRDFAPLELNAWVMLFSVPQLLVATLLFEPDSWRQIPAAGFESWAAVGYQAVIVTLGAYWLWNRAMQRYDINQIVPFTLTVPVFGVALGALVLGETVTLSMIVGGMLTVAGVAGVVLTRRRTDTATDSATDPG